MSDDELPPIVGADQLDAVDEQLVETGKEWISIVDVAKPDDLQVRALRSRDGMLLGAECHPRITILRVAYVARGVLVLRCSVCNRRVMAISVGQVPPASRSRA